MKKLLLVPLLFLSGCVTMRHEIHYANQEFRLGEETAYLRCIEINNASMTTADKDFSLRGAFEASEASEFWP
jgi:hypothetical protein